MKTQKILAIAVAVMAMAVSCKQQSEYDQIKAEVAKEVAAVKPSISEVDSVSYLLGVNYGMMLKGQGFAESMRDVNMQELKKGLEDAINASEPKGYQDSTFIEQFDVNPYMMNAIINQYLQKRHQYKSETNRLIGEKFLAANKMKEGVDTTATGLQYIIHNAGEGDKVTDKDTVAIKYRGTLIDGTEFDQNDSLVMVAGKFVPGFVEGLGLLGQGGSATLFIPAELAYGERAGQPIGPNSTILFDVEVLNISKFVPAPAEKETEKAKK